MSNWIIYGKGIEYSEIYNILKSCDEDVKFVNTINEKFLMSITEPTFCIGLLYETEIVKSSIFKHIEQLKFNNAEEIKFSNIEKVAIYLNYELNVYQRYIAAYARGGIAGMESVEYDDLISSQSKYDLITSILRRDRELLGATLKDENDADKSIGEMCRYLMNRLKVVVCDATRCVTDRLYNDYTYLFLISKDSFRFYEPTKIGTVMLLKRSFGGIIVSSIGTGENIWVLRNPAIDADTVLNFLLSILH